MIDYILIATGFVLGIIELLLGSFYVIFFAIGFFIVGVLGLLVEISLEIKLVLCVVLSLGLLLLFKKFFKKNQEIVKDNFLDESGFGIIKNGMVYYKGALWQANEISHLKEGDKIKIKGVENNKLILE